MHAVDPIRERSKILAIKKNLKEEKNPRNYLLFTFGINAALRSSDLLKLKVTDVLDNRGDIKEYFYVKTKKTGRVLKIKINDSMREALTYYLERSKVFNPDQYLFKSKRSDRPIDNVALFYLIKKWTRDVGLTDERYSSHSFRKTWGYQARKLYGLSIEMISEKLGHSSTTVTRKYIGINQDEVNKAEEEVNL